MKINSGPQLAKAIKQYVDSTYGYTQNRHLTFLIRFIWIIPLLGLVWAISYAYYHIDSFSSVMLAVCFFFAFFAAAMYSDEFFQKRKLVLMLSKNCETVFVTEERQHIIYYTEGPKYQMENYFITELYVPVVNLKYSSSDVVSTLKYVLTTLEPNYKHVVTIYPIAPATESFDSLHDNLLELMQHELNVSWLPEDIYDKSLEMSETYLYLYCIENTLRKFIGDAFINKYGMNYNDQITVPHSVKKKITDRKSSETQNKWLSQRGDDFLFYLDFKELADLILNNWNDVFKDHFPSQQWISIKIDELGNIRNLVAHNSYINTHDKRVLVTNYHSIVRQLGYI